MDSKLTIVYIAGNGHTGSTLLSLILASHSAAVGIGESKDLCRKHQLKRERGGKPLPKQPCMCGATTVNDCSFWMRVDHLLQADFRLSLWDLDVCNSSEKVFVPHNYALYHAIAKASGRSLLIDSSKNWDRLELLLRHQLLPVRSIHITRSPYGVIYSNLKRGREDLKRQMKDFVNADSNVRRILNGEDHSCVSYEKLVKQPRQVVSELMSWLGFTFEESQLKWAEQEHHFIAGNQMRYSKNSEIKLDQDWRDGLTLLQKAKITYRTLPFRLWR